MSKGEVTKEVVCDVFQYVTEYHKARTDEAKPQSRNPYTPISPEDLQRICKKAGANNTDIAQIVSFCVSIVGGLLSSANYSNILKAADMGDIIVQIENLKAIK